MLVPDALAGLGGARGFSSRGEERSRGYTAPRANVTFRSRPCGRGATLAGGAYPPTCADGRSGPTPHRADRDGSHIRGGPGAGARPASA
ncbi:hypothetical protein [Ornithinimicrobium kibberense]|uniref:hypothetical protein n=1 Tax=Ornithinimicrobium kibberense TaxID=282060 RepID=UPI003623A889